MKDFLDKLSAYDIFNYLMPGIAFAVLAANITSVNLIQSDIVIGVFVYYFIGLIISRVGSLIIEPVLKWAHFIETYGYKEYADKAKNDPFLDTLLRVNNMYRTICSMSIFLLLLKVYDIIVRKADSGPYTYFVIPGLFFILFIFAVKKQTGYIRKRLGINPETS